MTVLNSRIDRLIGWVMAAFVLVLLMGGCEEVRGQMNLNESAAIDVARKYVEKNLPTQSHVLKYRAFAVDRDENWAVTFMPPGEVRTGGVPEIYVDKKSLQVNRVEWAQ